jgi:hypothetical protein
MLMTFYYIIKFEVLFRCFMHIEKTIHIEFFYTELCLLIERTNAIKSYGAKQGNVIVLILGVRNLMQHKGQNNLIC